MKPSLTAPARAGVNGSRRTRGRIQAEAAASVRVAVYCRVSLATAADARFTSLEAQRAAIEAFVLSQAGKGWVVLDHSYSDDGFSGGNTNRPAFQRLLRDIDSGLVDVVAVYRLDRISRRQVDFLQLLEEFESKGVQFCSISENLETSTPTGQMVMSILATFAQFERASIAARTKDKVMEARKRGLWTGGQVILGFDVRDKRLVINRKEAETVREIFQVYLELHSARKVAKELRERGIVNKTWKTQAGVMRGGKPFQLSTLLRLLANPLYAGCVRAGDEVVEGQHEAIVDAETWQAAQDLMEGNRQAQPSTFRNKHEALLKGLLRCGRCGRSMTCVHTKKGTKRYPYYVCQKAQKEGAAACPGSRVAARHVEGFVVERLRAIGRDQRLIAEVVGEVEEEVRARCVAAGQEARRWDEERDRLGEEVTGLLKVAAGGGAAARAAGRRLAEIEAAVHDATRRADAARAEIAATDGLGADERRLAAALASWDEVWASVPHRERVRLIGLLLEEVVFDVAAGEVELAFRASGLEARMARVGSVEA